MANPADRYAKKTFGQVESQISRMYREAYKDVSGKMSDFTRKHKAKDKQMQRDLKNGKITPEQYADWLRGQVFIGKQWQDAKASINATIKNVMNEAASLTHSKSIDVFVDNANYTAYQIEKDLNGGVNFSLYDRKTVSRLIREDPELLPRKVIDGKKADAWNTKTIANCISQAIIQGEGIDELSKRIARDTGIEAGRSSLLYARTAMTGAQNAGRVERMKEAEEMGIKVQKQWMATLDDRTRDTHAELDGEIVDVDDKFSNGLMYPGDPSGDPSEVYNCRCTMIYHYPGYSNYANMERTAYFEEGDPEYDPDHRNYETVKGMNYEQWTEYKQDQIRQRYGAEPTAEPKEDKSKISVSSDEELQALRDKQKDYEKELEDIRKEYSNLNREKFALDNEYSAVRDMEKKLDNPDLQVLDRFKSEKELKEYRHQIEEDIQNMQNARSSIKRPGPEDSYASEEEYRAAWNKYYKDKEEAQELLDDLYKELRVTYDYRWSDIEDYREAKSLGLEGIEAKKDEIKRKQEELDEKIKANESKANEVVRKKNAENEVKVIDYMDAHNVEYREPESNLFGGTKPTTDEVVERIAGGDMTSGSCASVGLCYIGQKDGWDVTDFRGGESMDFFANGMHNKGLLRGISMETGKPLLNESTQSGAGGAIRLVKQMVPDNEYYFVTARHAAIMRNHDGYVEYMELQSSWRNGWIPMAPVDDRAGLDRGFRSRFGSSKSISGDAYMMDINDMKDSKLLHRAYGYLNTAEDEQKKGASGHER